MTLRIGIIGPGRMGQSHLDRIRSVVSGGEVVAVSDIAADNVRTVAQKYGVQGYHTSAELIGDPDVAAVMVTSHGPAHADDVIAAVEAGKRVFCEKPLAPKAADCLRIMETEQRAGRKLVTVGFMRRFDESYRQMRQILRSGQIGEALMVHCAHRNPTVPGFYTWDMAINDTSIHEIDIMRWLLEEEFVRARVDQVKRTRHQAEHLRDPMVLVLQTASGVRVDDELFVNCQYGYDIHCELVGEDGVVRLGDQDKVLRRSSAGVHHRIAMSDNERFAAAFVTELQEWIDAASRDEHAGPTSWDGYAAACACDAGLRAVQSGQWADVEMIDKPALYA